MLRNLASITLPRAARRQLSAKASTPNVHTLSRGQSTLSAHVEGFAFSLNSPSFQTRPAADANWADEAERWLANRRAAEFATDVMTAGQLSPFVPVKTAHSWKDEYAAWLGAPAVAAKFASTSYAEAARPAASPEANTWADETESWLAQRGGAEHRCDQALVQEVVWFK